MMRDKKGPAEELRGTGEGGGEGGDVGGGRAV